MLENDIFLTMSEDNETRTTPVNELRVLSGLHKGAALTLSLEAVTIGSDPNCTVVLLDEGVMPLHLSLQWIEGKGWVQEDSPDVPLSGPLRVGPVWLCVVPPDRPWTDVDLLRSEEPSHTEQHSPPATHRSPGLKLGPMTPRTRILALLGVFISSVLLLLITIAGLRTDLTDTVDDDSVNMKTTTLMHKPSMQVTTNISSNPPLENPNKDVIAVVSGTSGFVMMRDGRSVYVGDEVGHFILVDVQSAIPLWRSKLQSLAEE